MGTHFSFLFSIYSKNHGVQAEPLNFARSSDITYVMDVLFNILSMEIAHFDKKNAAKGSNEN